jgi:hypothetical protein
MYTESLKRTISMSMEVTMEIYRVLGLEDSTGAEVINLCFRSIEHSYPVIDTYDDADYKDKLNIIFKEVGWFKLIFDLA